MAWFSFSPPWPPGVVRTPLGLAFPFPVPRVAFSRVGGVRFVLGSHPPLSLCAVAWALLSPLQPPILRFCLAAYGSIVYNHYHSSVVRDPPGPSVFSGPRRQSNLIGAGLSRAADGALTDRSSPVCAGLPSVVVPLRSVMGSARPSSAPWCSSPGGPDRDRPVGRPAGATAFAIASRRSLNSTGVGRPFAMVLNACPPALLIQSALTDRWLGI